MLAGAPVPLPITETSTDEEMYLVKEWMKSEIEKNKAFSTTLSLFNEHLKQKLEQTPLKTRKLVLEVKLLEAKASANNEQDKDT